MNIVATTLAPALVVGLAALTLVGPLAGALGGCVGLALGWAVAASARGEAPGDVSTVRDAGLE